MNKRKPVGWQKEPMRHSLASRGIKTNLGDMVSKGKQTEYAEYDNIDFFYNGDIYLILDPYNEKYIGRIDSDGVILLDVEGFSDEDIKNALMEQMMDISPDDWTEEWILAVGEENLPHESLKIYKKKWHIGDEKQ